MFNRFGAVLEHKVLNSIAFTQMKHNAIDCIFLWHVNQFFCSGLSCCNDAFITTTLEVCVWPYSFYRSTTLANDASAVRSTPTIFRIPSSFIEIAVSEISIILNNHFLRRIWLLYDSVARNSPTELAIGGWSKNMYCAAVHDPVGVRTFWL